MKPGEKLRVVLDTNVVLDALSPKLALEGILRNLISGKYELCVTTEILLEYEELIARFYSPNTARTLLDAFLASTYIHKIEVYFRFNILHDLDDNKFLDCAFAGNADFIVSSDRHFQVLKNMELPAIAVIKPGEFLAMLSAS